MDSLVIFLGVVSSILAAILIYIFKSSFRVVISSLFGHVYPNISGTYKLEHLQQSADEDIETIVTIKQFTNRVRGSIVEFDNGKIASNDKLNGAVSPTRVVKLQFESISPEHHEHGAMLLKLSPDGTRLTGHKIFLCAVCENTGEEKVDLFKC